MIVTTRYAQEFNDSLYVFYNFSGKPDVTYNVKFCIKDSLYPDYVMIPKVIKGAIGLVKYGRQGNKNNIIRIPRTDLPSEITKSTYYEITIEETRNFNIKDFNETARYITSNINDCVSLVIGIEDENIKVPYVQNGTQLIDDYFMKVFRVPYTKRKYEMNRTASHELFERIFQKDGWLHNNITDGITDVIIYFAGQCIVNDKNKLYLLPYEGNEGFSLDEIVSKLEGFNPRSVTFFMEFSIKNNDKENHSNGFTLPVPATDKISLIIASRPDQNNYNIVEEKMSLFSYELLRGLSGEADLNRDRTITFGELYEFIKKNVWDYSVNIIHKEQDPVIYPSIDMSGGKADWIMLRHN